MLALNSILLYRDLKTVFNLKKKKIFFLNLLNNIVQCGIGS